MFRRPLQQGAYLGDCERVGEIGAGGVCDAHAGVARRL
jgi:hypothetical protein